LSSLDKNDAQLFTNLCKFAWVIGGFEPLIYDFRHEIYNKWGINFESLTHLDSIGLIQYDAVVDFDWMKIPKEVTVYYYGAPMFLEFQKETDNKMGVGHAILTKVGRELAPICGSQPDAEFREYVLKKWKEMGYIKAEKTESN
jgi:hypothetical protein